MSDEEITRRPLGPNESADAAGEQPYVYQAWPAWRYGPDGQKAIFQGPEEVPEGWTDVPPTATPAGEAPVHIDPSLIGPQDDDDDDDEGGAGDDDEGDDGETKPTAEELAKAHKKEDLVAMLELMAEKNDKIEFSPRWGEVKLAQAIIDHGGPIVETEE